MNPAVIAHSLMTKATAPDRDVAVADTLLTTYRGSILPEWVDYNGHLRDAFYLLIFSYASDALADHLGLDAAGRAATGHSIFTLECHLNYFHEVKQGAPVQVRTQLLGHGNKRLHLYHRLHGADASTTLASNEQLLTNVDMSGPRTAPFAGPVLARLQRLAQLHRELPVPPHVGRVIRLMPDQL